MKTVYYIGDIT